MPYEGQVGTAPDGTKVVFRGGKAVPMDSGPQDVSSEWGQGARKLPNGDIVAFGPRGGRTVLQAGGGGADPSHAAVKLTEDQGKSQTYARLLTGAERAYDRALDDGYDPGSPRNATASVFEGLPWGGLDGIGALIRDDVGDRGRQAELQWSDAQLKAVSGAAAPEAEVKRGVRTFFPRPGETMSNISPQKLKARIAAFDAAKVRAGPAGKTVPAYPQNLPKPIYETAERLRSQGRINEREPLGSQANPYVARSHDVADRLPKGSYVITPEGHLGIVE
jgi:hypothetical protein